MEPASFRLFTAALMLCAGCGGSAPEPAPPSAPELVGTDTTRIVQAEMRNVDFSIDSGVVLEIARLSGELIPSSDTAPPAFNNPRSFTLSIRSAEISIDTASLGTLLRKHVFAYQGSPLGGLRVSIDSNVLVQKGVLKKGIHFPFTVKSEASLTPEGLIRLHPTSIKVLGVGARGLMRFFGLSLEELARVDPRRGVRIEGNDFLIDPTAVLPPPRVRGRVTALSIGNGRLHQVFGNPAKADSGRLVRPDTTVANYMYFRGGTLRFGKLTMADADMLIQDEDPSDRFRFNLSRYFTQLVAGSHRTTRADGLIVRMPDWHEPTPAKHP
ncbi:MAG TPA: hypothetical protein VFU23_11055 [Gemmatimonadales bacterium]|nr:hypothetical protein [Gemmatimonadales bacterium]